MESMLYGIDISAHNGQPNLSQLEFVICRAAYGNQKDSRYDAHMAHALAEQVHRPAFVTGAYLFLRPPQYGGSIEKQVGLFLDTAVGTAELLAIDWEYERPWGRPTAAQRDQALRLVQEAGSEVALYASLSGYPWKGRQNWLWVAAYGQELPAAKVVVGKTIHQYAGIGLDRDKFFGDYDQLHLMAGRTLGVDSMLNVQGYPKRTTVAKDTPFYSKAGDAVPLADMSSTAEITIDGRVLDPGGGWYLGIVRTSAGWPDGQARDSGVYFKLAEPVTWAP